MVSKEDILNHFQDSFYPFFERFLELKGNGSQLMARCPFHDDVNPSLSINPNTGQWKCFGCDSGGDIFTFWQKLKGNGNFNKTLREIAQEFKIPETPEKKGEIVEVYDYVDESGKLLFQVCRLSPKDFRQRRPDGNGGWIWNMKDTRRVLYQLPEVIKAGEIFVIEGERDVHALMGLGLTSTTNPGGAGKWKNEYSEYLRGKRVFLLPDNDDPGKQHMVKVGKSLIGRAKSIKWLELPGLPPGGDFSDWLNQQEDNESAFERLSILIENAEPFNSNILEKPFPTACLIIDRLKKDVQRNKERGSLGIDPGFEFLRKSIRAFIPGHLWVIGGYTSHGKTALAVELISRVISNTSYAHITLFSTEMTSESYVLRLVANQTGIPSLSLFQGNHIPEIQQRVDRAFEIISKKNLIIFDDIYDFGKMAEKARDIKNKVGLDILFIDFIQNLMGEGSIYERMSRLAPQLQALAKELTCTVVALSQVSNEAVRDNSPVIGFKGAGEIAAASDLALWLEKEKNGGGSIVNSDILNIIIRKNRHGPTGKKTMRFKNNFTRLEEE